MKRLFAVGTYFEGEMDLSFVTIDEADMEHSDNLGVDALTIMKVKALGYVTVMNFAEEFMLEPSIGGSIETIVDAAFQHCSADKRVYKEYV